MFIRILETLIRHNETAWIPKATLVVLRNAETMAESKKAIFPTEQPITSMTRTLHEDAHLGDLMQGHCTLRAKST